MAFHSTLTTLHANGVGDVPARVEALAMLSGIERSAAHSLLASALHAAVQLRRLGDGRRVVAEIAVLARGDEHPSDGEAAGGLVSAWPALSWSGESAPTIHPTGAGRLRGLLASRGIAPPAELGGP